MHPPFWKILLVDDEPAFCEVLRAVLEVEGHEVEVAHDGSEALSRLEIDRFDLVITDFEMPFMKGDELAAEIRRREPDLPIVLMTGHAELFRSSLQPLFPFESVLVKPFSFQNFTQTIASAVATGCPPPLQR